MATGSDEDLTRKIAVGDRAVIRKTITETDIGLYVAISLDTNPVHVDEKTARASIFGERIAHGMLTASLISAVLGTKLPGPGTIYLEQNLRFIKPVKIGTTIQAAVEVTELLPRFRVRLQTTCTDEEGNSVLDGSALVISPA